MSCEGRVIMSYYICFGDGVQVPRVYMYEESGCIAYILVLFYFHGKQEIPSEAWI
jgi:hypothetical protein